MADLLPLEVEFLKFFGQVPLVLAEEIVVLLIGVEAVEAGAVTLQRDEERRAADSFLAGDAGRRESVDDYALVVVSKGRAFGLQSLDGLSCLMPVTVRIDFNPQMPDLLYEVFVDPRVYRCVGRQTGILNSR